MGAPELLVSLHDVSPRHEAAVELVLSRLRELGLPPAVLLVVPDFHGGWALADHPAFLERLRAWKAQGHELALHGYFHLEQPEDSALGGGPTAFLRRRFLTAGEGEFLSISPERARERIRRGLDLWETCGLGEAPRGFVPPAWLHRPDLSELLWDLGFSWTEDHHRIFLRDGSTVPTPVITWASRDPVRRIGSRIFAPLALRSWREAPLLRIAIHPHDWDHPELVASISATILSALERRRPVSRID